MDVLLAHNPIVDYVFKAMALRAVRTTANSSQWNAVRRDGWRRKEIYFPRLSSRKSDTLKKRRRVDSFCCRLEMRVSMSSAYILDQKMRHWHTGTNFANCCTPEKMWIYWILAFRNFNNKLMIASVNEFLVLQRCTEQKFTWNLV